MKKIAVVYDEYAPVIDAIVSQISDSAKTDLYNNYNFNPQDYDLILSLTKENCDFNVIRVHKSLLPSFNSDEPVKEAFLAGVKVTGITVYYTKPFKIISQYPVFISNDKHFDDTEKEIDYIIQILLPKITEKIIKNEPFNTQSMMKNNSCGGCNGCKK